MTELIYPKLSYIVVGICFKVHNDLGRFQREVSYANRLEEYLIKHKIQYHREEQITKIFNAEVRGDIPDFVLEKKIILDLKAKRFIKKDDYYQMKRYLTNAHLKLGIIVNFRDLY